MENESKRFRHQAWRFPDAINPRLESSDNLIVDGVFSNSQLSIGKQGALNSCKGCDWIQHGFMRVSGESLSLLHEMGGDITDETVRVPFPRTLYRSIKNAKVDDKLKFLDESFHQIIKLFHGNLDAVTWNRQKLDHFLGVLNRQSQELQRCISSTSKHEKNTRNMRRLNRYFRKLKKEVLKQRKYDSHSWELIRKEVRRHLQRLDLISASMKTPEN